MKTYITFLLVSGVLVGTLAYLYGPSIGPADVIDNIESRTLQGTSSSEAIILEPSGEAQIADSSTTGHTSEEPEDEEVRQRRRIHYTKILLRKQQQLINLQDRRNRTTGSTEAIDNQIEDVELFIEKLKNIIKAM